MAGVGNPDIKQIGEETRFGNGKNDPLKANAAPNDRGAMRKALKKIARHMFDLGPDAPPFDVQMKRVFSMDEAKLTGAELVAVRKFQQAMAEGKYMDKLIDHVDGKLVDRKVEATVTLADIINKSYEIEDDGTGSSSE